MSLKVGVIGAGKWGQNHMRVYSETDCDFVGIADINPATENIAKKYGVKYYMDYNQLLSEVDAVSVVVPTTMHYKVVKDCLNAGKHVIVEKPMTLKSSEARELMKLARKKGLVLMVGYLFRFNAATKMLKESICSIGEIQHITARYVHSNKPPRNDSGVIFNFATHLIDILNFVLEMAPKSVYCKKKNFISNEREDFASIILDYGKFMATLEVTWFHPLKKRDMWVIGSKEKIYVDFLEQIMEKYPISLKGGRVVSKSKISIEIKKNEPLKEELRYFCKSASAGKNGLNVDEESITRICEACVESARTGKELKLK